MDTNEGFVIAEEMRTYRAVFDLDDSDQIAAALHNIADIVQASGMSIQNLLITRQSSRSEPTMTIEARLFRRFED
jgi:hypothetical protein